MARSDLYKTIRKYDSYLVGLAMLVLAVLAVAAGFSDSVSMEILSSLTFVLVVVVLLKTYFGWIGPRLATVFVISAVVFLAGAMWMQRPVPNEDQYQAVFLTNGQVYFGHFENSDSEEPILTDVYYLQSQQQNPQQPGQDQQAQLALVKLGDELHGPQDRMVLKSDQILFWEDLKDSGKVVQAIKDHKSKQ